MSLEKVLAGITHTIKPLLLTEITKSLELTAQDWLIMEQTSTSTKLPSYDAAKFWQQCLPGRGAVKMQSLCCTLTNILLTKIRNARLVIRYNLVALACDLQLLAYDTQVLPRDEAKNNIFSSVDFFGFRSRTSIFFLGESVRSNRLVCSNETVVLMFSLRK